MTDISTESTERVLSTLNADGTRRWLRPRLSKGRFLSARRWSGYALILIFTLIPWINVNDKPLILLNLVKREFTFFGATFLATDTLLLAIALVFIVVSIFLVTALLGRVWCGWACPQTVYMEFVFRPIERFFDGPPGPGGAASKKATAVGTILKYVVFGLISFYLANTFLAYWVGVDALREWVTQSPFKHPTPFIVMAATTLLMLFDFAFFREQTCIVACPYGRIQSVMLDRDSLIISYDRVRGEPRGPIRRNAPEGEKSGDCVDCGRCVETCPTGIDIRSGLQLECVGCAQCIDACDDVMEKIKRPRGLIRYTSQARVERQGGRLLRARVIVYPLILVVLGAAFGFVLSGKQSADVTVLRVVGAPFSVRPDGRIANNARIKLTNRSDRVAEYTFSIPTAIPAEISLSEHPLHLEPGKSRTEGVLILTDRSVFKNGVCDVTIHVTDGVDFSSDLPYRLLGPKEQHP